MSSYRTFVRILGALRPYWRLLAISVACSVVFSVFSGVSIYLTIPLLETLFHGSAASPAASGASSALPAWLGDALGTATRAFRDLVFRPDPVESLLNICIITVLTFLVKNLFGYVQSNLMTYTELAVVRDIRNRLYRHFHELPLGYFTNERVGNLISRVINDVPVIVQGISATFFTSVREPLLIAVYLGIALFISWKLTLISLVVVPLSVLIVAALGLRVHRQSGLVQARLADLTAMLQETFFGVKVVKAFGMEEFENRRFGEVNEKAFRTAFGVFSVRNLASPTTEFLGAVAGAVVIWYGGLQVLGQETLKASEFLGFLFAIFQIMHPVKELSSVNNRIQEATAAGKRVFEVLDTRPAIVDAPGAVAPGGFRSHIEFRDVGFRYDGGDMVLADINLTIRKGEVVAIVGPSGAGKSSLVDLIPRFYDPSMGAITIDGTDLRLVRVAALRDLIGIVTQETILFNDTVRNNIAYGLDDCPLERVIEAAKAANAHNFIVEMPARYDSIIGERGVKVSGGERQRLALARAILKNPPILILDEATSALDTESEILVQEAMDHLMAGRTSIVIAHRLSTVQHADRILVLEAGRIVESGRHEELLANEGGLYRKLYELQFRV